MVAFSSFGAIAPPDRIPLDSEGKSDFGSEITFAFASAFTSAFISGAVSIFWCAFVSAVIASEAPNGCLVKPAAGNTCRICSVFPPKDVMKDKTKKTATAKMTTTERCRAIFGRGESSVKVKA